MTATTRPGLCGTRESTAILRCRGPADVLAGVEFARAVELPLSVKGGGHHISGSAVRDGALTLDTGVMDWVRVDLDDRTVRVGAGATWGDVDHETQYTTGTAAMNCLTDDETDDRVRAACGDNYDRLAAVKAQWDPDDIFGAPQTVPPDGG